MVFDCFLQEKSFNICYNFFLLKINGNQRNMRNMRDICIRPRDFSRITVYNYHDIVSLIIRQRLDESRYAGHFVIQFFVHSFLVDYHSMMFDTLLNSCNT